MPSRRETDAPETSGRRAATSSARRHALRLEVPRTPQDADRRVETAARFLPEIERGADEKIRLLVHGHGRPARVPVDLRDDAPLAEARELRLDPQRLALDRARERLGGDPPASVHEAHHGAPAHEGEARRVEGGPLVLGQ